jgi:hypothetical protein
MTLSLAWVRSVGNAKELIMATDSRLRAGRAWDVGPKILALPRSDCAICFAGDTDDAYPLMLHMASAVGDYPKSRSRGMDIHDLKGHTLRVFDHLRTFISDLPHGKETPDPANASFIFGGYSWRKKRFAIWLLHFDTHLRKFAFRPATRWREGNSAKQIMFAGDYIPQAKARLVALLRDREKLTTGGFDMEPFEVLRDMIRSHEFPLIGGAPQILKIYEFLNIQPYAVTWPQRDAGTVTLLGRPLLPYERTTSLILDPDTLETYRQPPIPTFVGEATT